MGHWLWRLLLDIPTSHIRRWLTSQEGEVRTEGSDDELLRRLGEHLKLRGSKSDLAHLRGVLCEMAARGQVALEFGTEHMGSAPIVAIKLVGDSPAHEITRLNAHIEELFDKNAELQRTIAANAGDVEAAEQLVGEAEAGRSEAEAALEALKTNYAALEVAVAGRQAPPPQSRPKRRTVTERQLTTARARAVAAEVRVSELLALLSETRRKLRLVTRGYEFYNMTCGCLIARGDTSKCMSGGKGHPFFPIALPGVSYAAAKEFLSIVVAEANLRVTGDLSIVAVNDIRGRREP